MALELRRVACQSRRLIKDRLWGHRSKFVNPEGDLAAPQFPERVKIEQPILPTDYVEAKIHNISLAIKRINNLVISPGAILSFWHMVGRPTAARGYVPGRSLLGGKLVPDYGGGLCQLSGLIYYTSLIAGLRILERHPHSRDLYDDQSRYAPLGADATVAYGFKDLRVVNSLFFPICFRVEISPTDASCAVCSPEALQSNVIDFTRTGEVDGVTVVETRRLEPGGDFQVLNVSRYRRLCPDRVKASQDDQRSLGLPGV